MSSSHDAPSPNAANVLDTWWPLLVIVFGLIFFAILISWKPGNRGPSEPAVKPMAAAGAAHE